ncbi:hypothetical protein BSKO_06455 [Bryopsis sp. KO-2023]|nr:hypothetical protein BSKO_06455 [Bryopsis sp. KO-2023]
MAAAVIQDSSVQYRPTRGPTVMSLEERLSREVLRKLRLASESVVREDRETVCEEVFGDVTGTVDACAREALEVSKPCCFYEILSDYYARTWSAADSLLTVCRGIWGQPFVAAIYTLLLHRWLLGRKSAGGTEQRQKHLNVLVAGARQLFWIDVHADTARFRPLYDFISTDVVLHQDASRLDSLPGPARAALVTLVACFMPYYTNAKDILDCISNFPSPEIDYEEGKEHRDADFLFGHITDTLRAIKAEPGLVRYLSALTGLKACVQLREIKTVTRLRLQAELYSLTSPGGPRYASREIRHASLQALDTLFPAGATSRRIVGWAFRLLHPTEWPGSVLAGIHRWTVTAQTKSTQVVTFLRELFVFLFIWVLARLGLRNR